MIAKTIFAIEKYLEEHEYMGLYDNEVITVQECVWQNRDWTPWGTDSGHVQDLGVADRDSITEIQE